MVHHAALLLLFAFAGSQPPAEQTLKVASLPRDGQLLVSIKLDQGLTEEVRAAIRSGLPVSFVYNVDLRRSSVAWLDRTLASAVVKATVRYDNLTRRYHVSRTLDGRMDRAELTDREDVAWAWLTTQFDRLPLFRSETLEANAEYYLRVRAHSLPRNASFVWPWKGADAVGLSKFTLVR